MRIKFFVLHLDAFARGDNGATAIEYGLICSLIFLVIVSGVAALSTNISALFNQVATSV